MLDEEIRNPEGALAHMMNRRRNWFSAALLAALVFFNARPVFAQYMISTVATTGVTVSTGQPWTGNGVAVDAAGNIYLIGTYSSGGFPAIFEIRGGNAPVAVVGADVQNSPFPGCQYPPTQIGLGDVAGVTMDSAGNLYIAQDHLVSVLSVDGWTVACPLYPSSFAVTGIALDNSGNEYLAVGRGGSNVYKITPSGAASVAGSGGMSCNGGTQIGTPQGLAIDVVGNMYIADNMCNMIWKVALPSGPGANPGPANPVAGIPSNTLQSPSGLAVDGNGDIYIADTGNNLVRKVTGTTMTTIAGGTPGGSGNCVAATSVQLNSPTSVAVGPGGTIYIGEQGDIPSTHAWNTGFQPTAGVGSAADGDVFVVP